VVDAEKRLVRLAGGAMVQVAAIDHRDENVLVVRPHQLRFADGGTDGNVIDGRVHTVTFLGDRIRYVIETAATRELVVELVAGGAKRAEGEAVRVQLPAEHCRVI